jgi:hypothetical protein
LGDRIDAGLSRRCAQSCARAPTAGTYGSASAVGVPQSGAFDGGKGAAGIAIQCPESISSTKKAKVVGSQLSALSAWHLVNIAIEYELSDEPVERLNRLAAPTLVELIVHATRDAVVRHR